MTSLKFGNLCKDPVSQYTHSEVLGFGAASM